ncbi:tRNA (adenosine(37)-N6)-threonylcarbamoyltransferase complex ATPase subunit type 1 TsaE [Rhodohalobacter halophilus]|uniref:tRNA (adenosine(37)-N6)-threonylcarbamoyltransferase complex ATPase subunit type 1 TsaE n=1 Tax=Rhodohalobacter halophilus TaxID=1812810 RepID=UPI00083F70C1|nr:tRNA (adenosine(37)-N6)-threonylcarbamoyltransferase complex ATPase subunit type 1 TsaE [Rhodohalobacter halophilus]
MKKEISNSEQDTFRIAKSFAGECKPGDVICLKGDLGAGKTHFTKGFVTAFGIDANQVTSPTFSLINEYEGDGMDLFHFDFYRLEHLQEALEIGAEEYLYGNGICVVEWPERIEEIIPHDAKVITIRNAGANRREIIFE